jgi:hypothetical protein
MLPEKYMEIQRETTKKLQYKYPAFGLEIESVILSELDRLHGYSTTMSSLKQEHKC